METRKARNWYRWLWVSPFITILTAVYTYSLVEDSVYGLICPHGYRNCNYGLYERIAIPIALLGSALWHLVLLIPAFDRKSEFVRWHGWQALLLAGVRTAVPLGLVLLAGEGGLILAILLLIVIWFFGTRWGQRQAARADCSLARRFGREAALPPPEAAVEVIRLTYEKHRRKEALQELRDRGVVGQAFGRTPPVDQADELDPKVETLVEIIRHGSEKQERRNALRNLEGRGLVEPL
jgi:hypothetical protein